MLLFKFFAKLLRKFARIFGYDVQFSKITTIRDNKYERVLPSATYAPWRTDLAFIETYDQIKNNTLVDIYRCYELWQLVDETSGLDGAIIEIGVWRGGTGALIAKRAELSEITSLVYLCDTFTGVVKSGENDSSYNGGEHADTSKSIVDTLIGKLGLSNTKILTGVFPDDTSEMITDTKFRFCHVDVDVFKSANDIAGWIWNKLVIGGVIVFDDYGFKSCDGITKFVNQERKKNDRIVVHNLNGHGIIIKTKNSII
ncbi:MAG: TylF/MycF family methyltransferase [Endomicrobia bacterium]|nr:TylF/MycF family methyltransferase [Endomicrobiia bacterium]